MFQKPQKSADPWKSGMPAEAPAIIDLSTDLMSSVINNILFMVQVKYPFVGMLLSTVQKLTLK